MAVVSLPVGGEEISDRIIEIAADHATRKPVSKTALLRELAFSASATSIVNSLATKDDNETLDAAAAALDSYCVGWRRIARCPMMLIWFQFIYPDSFKHELRRPHSITCNSINGRRDAREFAGGEFLSETPLREF
jgi:hypothetical protein